MGKLYIVGTPIGNLADVTLRALEVLNSVGLIACEDTRHSQIFLNKHGIKKPLVSYHTHNEVSRADEILDKLDIFDVALITDAGMPCISDPGAILVKKAREKGVEIAVVPGPSALTSAIARAGILSKGFVFLGFLPDKKSDKIKAIEAYKFVEIPLIFYCAPHNLESDLAVLFEILGARKVTSVKELTKLHETVEDGILGEFMPSNQKGEFVLIVDGAAPDNEMNKLTIKDHISRYIALGFSKKDAVKQTALDRGIPKSEVYKEALDL